MSLNGWSRRFYFQMLASFCLCSANLLLLQISSLVLTYSSPSVRLGLLRFVGFCLLRYFLAKENKRIINLIEDNCYCECLLCLSNETSFICCEFSQGDDGQVIYLIWCDTFSLQFLLIIMSLLVYLESFVFLFLWIKRIFQHRTIRTVNNNTSFNE